ncbi:MAG: hypothetical protein OEM15_16800 [Myxococcales bacterium]|nr:hypothetical protein [Myxococcales bacterium]MDH3482783.1 hypothetical protein [Myxococcales bacterium]
MASPVDDRGVEGFLRLLNKGAGSPRAKSEALEAMVARDVWLATWEPRAEGFRTLINGNGEEALAVFSSESELMRAAGQFGWLDSDGGLATHESAGGDILRHAWTREYAFVVVDIAAAHSLEYDREELRVALREMDATGPFRTSRPPAPNSEVPAPLSSFPPPVEKPSEQISTMYSLAPSHAEKLIGLSDRPTKTREFPDESEPPTKPHRKPAGHSRNPITGNRPSSRPDAKSGSNPPPKIEEIVAESAKFDVAGTYGAASIVPPTKPKAPAAGAPSRASRPASEAAPRLNSDAPTAPAARASDLVPPGKLGKPPVAPIGQGRVNPPPPVEKSPPDKEAQRPSPVAASAIGDAIELVQLQYPPDEELMETFRVVLRRYPEVEWASYCKVGHPGGDPSPAIGLRVMDTYRENVTAIIKELSDVGRARNAEIDVLLIDGHDLLRKARERAFVFFPWKPKPLGS